MSTGARTTCRTLMFLILLTLWGESDGSINRLMSNRASSTTNVFRLNRHRRLGINQPPHSDSYKEHIPKFSSDCDDETSEGKGKGKGENEVKSCKSSASSSTGKGADRDDDEYQAPPSHPPTDDYIGKGKGTKPDDDYYPSPSLPPTDEYDDYYYAPPSLPATDDDYTGKGKGGAATDDDYTGKGKGKGGTTKGSKKDSKQSKSDDYDGKSGGKGGESSVPLPVPAPTSTPRPYPSHPPISPPSMTGSSEDRRKSSGISLVRDVIDFPPLLLYRYI